MPDLPDWSQSVSIDAASVTIPVSGTVSITSGTVTITNASIAVINASGTKITSARPPSVLDTHQATAGNTVNAVISPIPSDVQALVFQLTNPLANYAHIKVEWRGATAFPWVPFELFSFQQSIYAVPMLPIAYDENLGVDSGLFLTLTASAAGSAGLVTTAIFESAPLWLQVFPLPQLEPNQFPKTVLLTLASLTAQWIIQSVVNVQITLFNIVVMRYNPSVANDDFQIGYSAALPANGSAPPAATILVDSTQTAASGTGPMFTVPLAGVQLPRGSGLWADTSLSAIANLWLLVEYSLG